MPMFLEDTEKTQLYIHNCHKFYRLFLVFVIKQQFAL